MNELTSCDGRELKGMFSAATRWLERSAQSINTLNVFPVPDGDTGTNMLLTMRAAMEEVSLSTDGDAASIANAMAKGTLMGARGTAALSCHRYFAGWQRGWTANAPLTAATSPIHSPSHPSTPTKA